MLMLKKRIHRLGKPEWAMGRIWQVNQKGGQYSEPLFTVKCFIEIENGQAKACPSRVLIGVEGFISR